MKSSVFTVFGVWLLVQLLSPGEAKNVGVAHHRQARDSPDPGVMARELPDFNPECTPEPDSNVANFIVGYGSLMSDASRNRTEPNTLESSAVEIKGFRREWNLKGTMPGPDTTYLGVVEDPESTINCVIFQLVAGKNEGEDVLSSIKKFDAREHFYCRKSVEISNIKVLGGQLVTSTLSQSREGPTNAKYWIYVNKPEFVDKPTADYPIVQSYVDLFITGCLEQQDKHKLPDFTNQCIESTKGWSEHWHNDRIFPRRPFIHQPLCKRIDLALQEKIPQFFDKIKIEG